MKKSCISEESLIEYIENRLNDTERIKMETHLAMCDKCLEEVVIFRKMMEGNIPSTLNFTPEHVVLRAIESVKTLNYNFYPEKIFNNVLKGMHIRY